MEEVCLTITRKQKKKERPSIVTFWYLGPGRGPEFPGLPENDIAIRVDTPEFANEYPTVSYRHSQLLTPLSNITAKKDRKR
jgi:hypothetical protein